MPKKKPDDLLGAHVSIAGGVFNAPFNGKEATCDVVQMFTKSSNTELRFPSLCSRHFTPACFKGSRIYW